MPIYGFYRTRCSYGLNRSRQRFLCRSPRSDRENRRVSPVCRVPAAILQFSSNLGLDFCRLAPNTQRQPLIFYVARSPRRRRRAKRLHFPVRRGADRGLQRVKQVRMSVVWIGDCQRGRGGVAVAPVDGGSGAINVESQPEHGMRLIELDIFRQNDAFLTSNAHTKMQIVRKIRLGARSERCLHLNLLIHGARSAQYGNLRRCRDISL